MSPELLNALEDIREIRDDVKDVKKDVRQGFDRMNGRVKKLELNEAKREGRESLSGGADMTWRKMSFALVGILSVGMTLGLAIAQGVFK